MFEDKKDESKAEIKKHTNSKDDLYSCLKHSAEHHTSYKIYYSNFEIVDTIINNKYLVLRNNGYNDKIDERNIQDESDGYRKFIICFTVSISENVAMWVVYSKKKKDGQFVRGAMIPFSKNMMKKIYDENKNEIEYGCFKDGVFSFIGKTNEFELEICDVIYYDQNRKDDSLYDIKRSDSKTECKKDIIDSLPYVKKYYPWNYENECRLIVKIKSSEIDSKVNAVRLVLPDDVIESMKKNCVSSPLCINDSKMKNSTLMGQLDFS